jgi:hypothetical protein
VPPRLPLVGVGWLRGVLVGFGQRCRCPTRGRRTAWLANASCGIVIAKRISVVEVVGDPEPQPVDSHDDHNHDRYQEDHSHGSRKHCPSEST